MRTKHTIQQYEGDFELPYSCGVDGSAIVRVEGKRAAVGYLCYDTDCENPMTSCDGQGEIVTDSREHVITDDRGRALRALGLTDFGGRFAEFQKDYDFMVVEDLMLELLKENLLGPNIEDFLEFCHEEFIPDSEEEAINPKIFAEKCFHEIQWDRYGMVIPLWIEEIMERLRDQAWDTLQEQGKIGEYLAIPITYHDSCHGPGTTRIYTSSIDDCNGVWIPDECCIDNIKGNVWPEGVRIEWKGALGSPTEPLHAVVTDKGVVVCDVPHWADAQKYVDEHYPAITYKDLYAAAERYCEGVLKEYESWCNGECYGVVVAYYNNVSEDEDEPVWEYDTDDACWVYIGYEYAEEVLKEQMEDANLDVPVVSD